MSKSSSVYVCQSCGQDHARWQGQCSSCGAWNTLVEEARPDKAPTSMVQKRAVRVHVDPSSIVSLAELKPDARMRDRVLTQIGELDRVLGQGGGMVPGAVMLLGGEPGIGKSTLLTQVVVNLARAAAATAASSTAAASGVSRTSKKAGTTEYPKPILYVSGEESPHQISLRINRILQVEHKSSRATSGKQGADTSGEHILFVTTTDVDQIIATIQDKEPQLVIIDSIQTLSTQDLTGAAGSIGQLRECAERLTETVKRLHVPTFLVGHVTKDGVIAGPKVLEHIVDAVLELSGERTGELRLLRAIKNRFGATDEVGVFRFKEVGLEEVTNPSELFLEHAQQAVPGSATVCVMEGTRPLLLEVQALVVSSQLAMPRRVGRGIELPRIQVLSAVLQKHCGLPLGATDIFLSAAGGFKVHEPGVDLGLAVAMASSLKNKAVPAKTVFIGEVGLLGEIRAVSYLDRRIKEAKRLGFQQVVSRESHRSLKDILTALGLK